VTTPQAPKWYSARRLLRDALGIVALTLLYTGLAKVSLAAAAAHQVVSSIWPPSGLALFALVRFGLRFWPGIAIGAYFINSTSGVSPDGAALIALGNTLEAVGGAYLLTRVSKVHRGLDRVRDVLALAGFAGILSTVIAATIGVASLVRTGSAAPSSALALWAVWWSGDAVGVLVVAPLLLWWTEPEAVPARTGLRTLEIAVTFGLLVVTVDFLFREWGTYVYPLYPFVTWIALRQGRRGAATAVAIVTVMATWYTLSSTGVFTTSTPLRNLFELQIFLVLLSVPSLLFAAARAEAQEGNEQRRQSEERYRQLARNLPDGCVVLYDRNLRFELAEGSALATAGFRKEEVEGSTLAQLFDAEHAAALASPFLMVFQGRSHEFEFSYKERTYLVRVLPLAGKAGAVALGMALALDITQRHAAVRQVAESRSRLEALTRRLLAAQEEERRRVAREVHDELGQALTGIKIGLGAMRSQTPRRSSGETDRRMVNVSIALDGAIEAVRRIILRLRPGVLDNLGPLAALEWEVQQFTQQSGIPVRLTLPPEPLPLDADRSTALYRTVQEALTNVLRHANATSVAIGLEADEHTLVLQVTDDGRGISDHELQNPRSLGILGMRERAMACGGTLEVRRAAGGGTRLVLTVPRSANGAEANDDQNSHR
jgi:PAS domain S-box-containing protein